MATDRVSSRAVPTFSSPLKHYTGVWCLFVAVLPIVVTQFGLIPVYESQRTLLPAYASFFCLLALAFVFSQRHRMARAMFAPRLLWPDEAWSSVESSPADIHQRRACHDDFRGAGVYRPLPVGLRDRTVIADVSPAATQLGERGVAGVVVHHVVSAGVGGVCRGRGPRAHSERARPE